MPNDSIDLVDDPRGRTCTLGVRAQPGAKRAGIAGLWNGLLKLRVAAPPEDGRANDELVALLARVLEVKRGDVELVSGSTARAKRFRIPLSAAEVRARLEPHLRTTEDSDA